MNGPDTNKQQKGEFRSPKPGVNAGPNTAFGEKARKRACVLRPRLLARNTHRARAYGPRMCPLTTFNAPRKGVAGRPGHRLVFVMDVLQADPTTVACGSGPPAAGAGDVAVIQGRD